MRETAFDEVFDSQAVFRALLDALSRPGTVVQIPPRAYTAAPHGFCLPALSILKTLCDHRVSFSVGSELRTSDWIRYLEVNLGSRYEDVARADWVLFSGGRYDPDFLRVKRGTPEFPESSATALLFVDALDDAPQEPEESFVLAGPGIDGTARLGVAGLDRRYEAARAEANRLAPTGVDVFLVDGAGNVAGIPRTARLGGA